MPVAARFSAISSEVTNARATSELSPTCTNARVLPARARATSSLTPSHSQDRLTVPSRSDIGNVWRNVKRQPEGYIAPGLTVVRWESGLFFGNSRGFARQIKALVSQAQPKPQWLVFDAEATGDLDFTATTMLEELVKTLRDQGVTFAVAEPNGRLHESLHRAGLDSLIGAGRIFPSVDAALKGFLAENPTVSARRQAAIEAT
jgi:MFS superfamily sulfate permease-like transporter